MEFILVKFIDRDVFISGACAFLKNIFTSWLSVVRSRSTRSKMSTRLFAFRPRVISYTLQNIYSITGIEIELGTESYTLKSIHGNYDLGIRRLKNQNNSVRTF